MMEGWGITLDAAGAFALDGVREGDTLSRLGLKSGDHFVAITAAGERVSLGDPWSAMHAYASLQTQTSFLLEFRRGSVTGTLSYRIIE